MGTRPEAIKMAPVIKAMRNSPKFSVKVCSTSQHKEMLQQVLEFFNVTVDYDLDVMEPNQSLGSLTAKIILQLTPLLKKDRPDWIFVQGDTTTAMAAAMAGFYEKIKIAHVEGGLRSFNLDSPFPEEMNRLVISRIATYHFCPTENAVRNLRLEGIEKNVFNTGNTVVDSVLEGIELISQGNQKNYETFFSKIDFKKEIILVTCHRRESFGEPFVNICRALVEIVNRSQDFEIVYPVHLNPNILDKAKEFLVHPRIHLIEPLSYPNLLWLLDKSKIVLTDSGGIQEEAPSLHKPVLILRDVTERTEGIEAGTATLVGTRTDAIVEQSMKLLLDQKSYESMAFSANPYGDGKASHRIVSILENGNSQ
jgi:UDP-N-acetylglucosamine 2-epimerase (non-hydrolysing)